MRYSILLQEHKALCIIRNKFSSQKPLKPILTVICRKYDGYPFVGIFQATSPCLLVRDPEFANRILVKDHRSFYNNDFFIDKKKDPLFGQNPFVLRDHEWKDTRHMLTPGFTGGKVKHILISSNPE